MVEINTNRSMDIAGTVNAAIANWATDGRAQLYAKHCDSPPLIYLFVLSFAAHRCTDSCSTKRRTRSKPNLVSSTDSARFRPNHESNSVFSALKQLLLSLCKSCLQGSQAVETIVRIFTELQVSIDDATRRNRIRRSFRRLSALRR